MYGNFDIILTLPIPHVIFQLYKTR